MEAIEERARQRAAGERQDESALEPSAELQAIQEAMIREQWEGWLDTRVPALRNKTPRQPLERPAAVSGWRRYSPSSIETLPTNHRTAPLTSPRSAPRLGSQSR